MCVEYQLPCCESDSTLNQKFLYYGIKIEHLTMTQTLQKNISKHGGNKKLHSLMGSVYKWEPENVNYYLQD